MKAVILAGGFGTRLSEETEMLPKPMIQIGGFPIIWHIMKIYSAFGVDDFIICLGYKGDVIKDFFVNYHRYLSDVTVDTFSGEIKIHQTRAEKWRVSLIETGLNTMTGGRLKRLRSHIGSETFLMTYGDGVADIDVGKLIAHHKESGALATVTAVSPPARFGALELNKDHVTGFLEKPAGVGGLINGGFFVLSPKVLDYIEGDATQWERQPMERLARERQLSAYMHNGFWEPMDTLRDKRHLEELWQSGQAPWKRW
jgi:glucose-1-phosphate cytidylyltransferase